MDRLDKWRKIYEMACLIQELEPWEFFREEDPFVFVPKGQETPKVASFWGETPNRCAIGLYPNETAWVLAQKRIKGKNPKHEPVFQLQNCIMAVWADREDLQKDSYGLIKELGIKCRGRGAWLCFEEYRVGYAPRLVPDEKLDELLDALGNLWMMVRAIVEQGMKIDFAGGYCLLREYSEQQKLYFNMAVKMKMPEKILYPEINLHDNDTLRKLRGMKPEGRWSVDWSYMPASLVHEGVCIFPRVLLTLDAQHLFLHGVDLIIPDEGQAHQVYEALSECALTNGKPAEIRVMDPELEAILEDFCKKTGIRLKRMKVLKDMTEVRNEFLRDFCRLG